MLADEINRATPKTQSALLEAMQDVSVSVGKTTYQLEQPFLVLATQNPLEMEGTYPLPEAQLDRFFFKLKVMYPSEEAMHGILDRTTRDADLTVTRVVDGAEILRDAPRRALGADRPAGAGLRDPADARLASRLERYATPLVKRYVRYGASPRAAQALVLAGKIPRPEPRAGVRVGRRHPQRGAAGAASSDPAQLRRRGDEVSTDTIVTEMLSQRKRRIKPVPNSPQEQRHEASSRPRTLLWSWELKWVDKTPHGPPFDDDFLKKLEYLHVVSEARVRRTQPRGPADGASRARASSSPITVRTRRATTSGTSTGRPTSASAGCCCGCSTRSATCRST